MKTCGCNKPCGCGQNVYSQNAPCSSGYPSCENPEPCSETFGGACVPYTGETIVNLNIEKGARMDEILQRLVGVITNPGCNYPDSPCKSPIVALKKTTNSTIALIWGSTGAATYQVSYRLDTSTTWIYNTATDATTDTIGGLAANSTYHVRVSSLCSSEACFSVILSITTKS